MAVNQPHPVAEGSLLTPGAGGVEEGDSCEQVLAIDWLGTAPLLVEGCNAGQGGFTLLSS